MTRFWSDKITEDELASAKSVMLTNMVAGSALAIPGWRYSALGSVAYAILRAMVYCYRHPRRTMDRRENLAPLVCMAFTPTCWIALQSIARGFPNSNMGFAGRRHHNFPLLQMLFGMLWSFRSPAVRSWVRNDIEWRPWMSDAIFYVLTLRWSATWLTNMSPRIFVYSNDHCCFDRGIVDNAARCGHSTVYVQHAAVTDVFPPLTAHYSLLDGEQALEVYKGISGSCGKAIICGRQYALAEMQSRRRPNRSALMCISTIDSVEDWRAVIKASIRAGYKPIIRTHPSERRVHVWRNLAKELDVQWLDPAHCPLPDALERCSVVVAGQSGVLLEAALSGATAVLVQFADDTARGLYDYFGFAAAGLAALTTPEKLDGLLARLDDGEAPTSLEQAAYFDLACVVDKNMQVAAINAIAANGEPAISLANAGFVEAEKLSSDVLKVFVPQHCAGIFDRGPGHGTRG